MPEFQHVLINSKYLTHREGVEGYKYKLEMSYMGYNVSHIAFFHLVDLLTVMDNKFKL